MLRTIFDVSAVTMTLVAAFFLARSSFTLSAAEIIEILDSHMTSSSSVISSLSKQQADARVGVFLLVLAFSLQFRNLLTPVSFDEIDHDPVVAIITTLVVLAIIIPSSFYTSHVISKRRREKVLRILFHQ